MATTEPQLANGPHGVGPINVSPKGGGRLHLLSPNRVAFLDRRGSGNETMRHSLAGSPVTVMVCSFEEDAAIVRLYGRAAGRFCSELACRGTPAGGGSRRA